MLWILALTACTGTDPADSGAATDTSTFTDSPTDTADPDTDSDTDLDTADTGFLPAAVEGRVVDIDGQPLENILVTLCRGSCVSDNTDVGGDYLLLNVKPDNYPISFVDLGGGYGVATPLFMLPVASGEERHLAEPMIMPPLSPRVALPSAPGDVEIVPGVTLTVDPEALWLAPWEPSDVVQGAQAPSVPSLVPFDDALAVWYLAPFKSLSDAPMPLTLDNAWGLAPGETAQAWVVSYFYADWVDAGTMTVSADGATLRGAAIEELTTLVLVRTPVE